VNEIAQSPAPLTIDDVRRKATHIQDMAEAQVRHIAADRHAQLVVAGVVVVLAAVSVAYYLGTRRR